MAENFAARDRGEEKDLSSPGRGQELSNNRMVKKDYFL
jgi:hypothetical protein